MQLLSNKKVESLKKAVKLDILKNITKNTPKQSNALDKVVAEQLERISKDIAQWRNAVESAEDIKYPDRYELIQMYKDFVDDYQLFAVMQSRILKSTSGSFMILDKDGEVDEEETRKFVDPQGFALPWFRDFMKYVVLSKFYGWEAIQLGNVKNDKFESVENIPEENLLPSFDGMLKNAEHSITKDNTLIFPNSQYDNWVVRVGSSTDLGLINKCAPFIIWKQVFGNWAQHASVFGMPLRVGKTNLTDNARRQNMIDAFESATGASYIIQDLLDEVQVIEQKGGGDPHNIYGMLIEKCDSAISKIVLSQTGTTDEKAFSGSANVHASTEADIIFADKLDIKSVVNELLIPRMKSIGMIAQEKEIFAAWDTAEKMSIKEWADTFLTLSQAGHAVPAEEVQKRTGIEVDETVVALPDNKSFSIMNKINQLYGSDNS